MDVKTLVETMRGQLTVVKEVTEIEIANDEHFKDKPGYKRWQDQPEWNEEHRQFVGAKVEEAVELKGGSEEFIRNAQPMSFDVLDNEGNRFQVSVERIDWRA